MEDEENFDILNNEENLEPIDGQIGIEELYVREDETDEIEEIDTTIYYYISVNGDFTCSSFVTQGDILNIQ